MAMTGDDPSIPARRRFVLRPDATRQLVLLAVAYGVTVVVTRLYLALSGYPQIGGGEYHIAHALWGGLLLMVAVTLALLLADRWVPIAVAVCGGAGAGLFVDEVGKFITKANDYFVPLAAPIIYLAFLAVFALVTVVRRMRVRDGRSLAHAVLARLGAVADGGLGPAARSALLADLDALEREPARPDLARLAAALRPVVLAAPEAEASASRWTPLAVRLARVERVVAPRLVVRLLLVAGLWFVGLLSLVGLAVFVVVATGDPDATVVFDDRAVPPGSRPPALLFAAAGETVVGAALLVSGLLLLVGRDRLAVRLGRAGLVLALAVVNVALGYVSAELVVAAVVVELALLGLLMRYRTRFLPRPVPPPGPT